MAPIAVFPSSSRDSRLLPFTLAERNIWPSNVGRRRKYNASTRALPVPMLIVDDEIMRQSTSASVRLDQVRIIGGQIIVTMFQCARIFRRPKPQCEKRPERGDRG